MSLALWAGFLWSFWKSLTDQRWRWWIVLALFATGALLTKYAAVLLFAAAATTMGLVPRWRALFLTYNPYGAFAILCLLSMPHWIWVVENNFITFSYAQQSINKNLQFSFLPSFYFPLRFSYGQLLNLLPVLLVFGVLIRWRASSYSIRQTHVGKGESTDRERRVFLLCMGFVPFLLSVGFSFIKGSYIYQRELHKHDLGVVLLESFGITLFYFTDRRIAWKRLPVAIACWGFLLLASNIVILSVPFFFSTKKEFRATDRIYFIPVETFLSLSFKMNMRPYFNVKRFADIVEEGWRNYSEKELEIVGGNMWLAANLSFGLPNRPHVFADADWQHAAWINREKIRRRGAVIVWEGLTKEGSMPKSYRKTLEGLGFIEQKTFSLPWRKKLLGREWNRLNKFPTLANR